MRPNHLLFLLLLILGTGLFAQETDAPKKEVNDMPMAVPDSLKFKANFSDYFRFTSFPKLKLTNETQKYQFKLWFANF